MLAVVGAGALISTTLFVRDATKGFEAAAETQAALDARLGTGESFVPWPDGSIPAERLDRFLEVRDTLAPQRAQLAAGFERFAGRPERADRGDGRWLLRLRGFFRIGGAVAGLSRATAELLETRNRALLEAQMSWAEYAYIYSIAYWAELGHSPKDNALSDIDPDEPAATPRQRTLSVGSKHHDERLELALLDMLRRQRDAAVGELRNMLAREVAALEADPERVPWQDGQPAQTAAALAPYRARLEATWSVAANPFELLRSPRDGNFDIQLD